VSQTNITALELVRVKRKFLEDYRHIIGDGLVDKIRLLVAQLRGSMLMLTASGGEVAELLNSLVPLKQD
jgi:hypothetical protein